MEKMKKDSFKLMGLKLENKTTNENNQSAVDCGNLWQKFESEKIADLIPEKLSNEIYAVYFDYDKDETAPFAYFIGCKVPLNAATPEGLSELHVPAQTYTQLIAKGAMTACLTEAWQSIWKANINRKFGFDFEVYDERSHDWNNAEVPIFISIKD